MIAILLISVSTQMKADPTYSPYGQRTSLGIRLGWVGAPNGLSVRKVVGPGQAFEFVGGYNPKYGRRLDIAAIKKGNSFVGASYAPFILMSEGNLGVAILADIGMRMNYHHYRNIGQHVQGKGGKITPEAIGGLGMQIEFAEKVEIFGDIHLKYYNEPHGDYVAGIESGMGIRFALN